MKGSFLRRNGSFGGRSKITHTFTSGILSRNVYAEIHEPHGTPQFP